ncbi:MAG: poly-gamma-glutamate synthase PgsB [Cyanobacteria bacterium]|jgi:poly-gamma-glutamate synthase PgsB/CapB|nr:poly-gamma-glutamate synthase PgsB [Cyanobacteria bacterium GSL.Bin21]
MTIFLLVVSGVYVYILWLLLTYQSFQRQRNRILFRVHVNGIRGKSTVTRYISAILREAGYHTFGKTTGSAARILRPDGEDYDFHRRGYPNVNEQVKIIKQFVRQKAEAVVMECMAVNPVYAQWLEQKVMRSHVGIITNVRYDHPDQMGETLEEIAESLTKSIPEQGILITAESNPRLLRILCRNAQKKQTRVIFANENRVNPKDREGFNHFAHESNIAIGYEIAHLLKMSEARALKAMQSAVADPGAFKVEHFEFEKWAIAWANLFAINDRESFISVCVELFKQYASYTKVVLLNNRYDRPERVQLFAGLAKQLQFAKVVTLGAYESEVEKLLSDESAKLLSLGFSTPFKNASGRDLLAQIVSHTNSPKVLLIGAVNIHTEQAEHLLDLFENLKQAQKETQPAIFNTNL